MTVLMCLNPRSTMARLQIKNAEGFAQSIELKLGTNRLGRNRTNDFPIDHPTVSGKHCEIVVNDESVLIRDLGSTNGTIIDGRAILEARLETGQTIQLGAVELVVETTVVAFTIPALELAPTLPALLADGSRACLNHPQARATRRCTQCHKVFCDACVHELQRVGGQPLNLCPACSGQCESLPEPSAAKPKKESFTEQLRKTLKITSRGNLEK